MEVVGRHYENGEPIRVTIEGERILSVEPYWPTDGVDSLPFVAPGLFDIQINGYGGTWFVDEGLTVERVLEMLSGLFRHGLTRVCPTLVTAPFDTLAQNLATLDEACRRHSWVEKMVVGFHLEGPYISPEDGPRGAHPADQVRPADWDEFCRLQQAAGGRIRLVTVAPEVEGAVELIRRAADSGVVPAIGHTAAGTEQIRAAVEAGARLSTHLGNGAHPVLPRHPNYIWDQLAEPRLMASLITDGFHLPASVVRCFVRAKGLLNTIVTCDAAGLAGCPPGRYRLGSTEVEVRDDGRLVVADQPELLAGSGVFTDTCVGRAVQLGELTLTQALDLAARNPARLLGVEEVRLKRGSRADLIVFRYPERGGPLQVEQTIAAGQVQWTA